VFETDRVGATLSEGSKHHRDTNNHLAKLTGETGGEEMITAIVVGGALVALSIIGLGLMSTRGAFKPPSLPGELMEKLAAHFGSEEKVWDRATILAPRLKELEQRRLGSDQAV
jgi:hypothetical protein